MSERKPDWDLDKPDGEESEALVEKMRSDILSGTIEVKHDHKCRKTGNIYVEYECKTSAGWKPSGIATTKADTWAFHISPIVLMVPTQVLKRIGRAAHKGGKRGEQPAGPHPTRGTLIPLNELVTIAIRHLATPTTGERPAPPPPPVTAAFGTCSYPDKDKHKAQHHPHPLTGRVICWLCHPPATSPKT